MKALQVACLMAEFAETACYEQLTTLRAQLVCTLRLVSPPGGMRSLLFRVLPAGLMGKLVGEVLVATVAPCKFYDCKHCARFFCSRRRAPFKGRARCVPVTSHGG